jgi:GT2 family glycosyltransferase
MLDLSIVIVSYNAKNFLRKCLVSIFLETKNIQHEIIVVDNNSSDSSAKMVRKEFPQVKIVVNKENVGFSKANNQGIKISKESRYVLFLNPDTIIRQNALEEMIKFMDSHKDAGASTCKLVMLNGEIDDATHRGFPTPWNSFCHFSGLARIFPKSRIFAGYNLGWMNLDSSHKIDVLAGAFMLVRREAGEDAKWWDEDYFFYGEDIDFCYMLKEKGWNIYYVPQISITHFKGVSGGIKSVSKDITTASTETKKRVTKWRFKAMKIFYNKHYKQKYPWIVNSLVNLGISIKQKI